MTTKKQLTLTDVLEKIGELNQQIFQINEKLRWLGDSVNTLQKTTPASFPDIQRQIDALWAQVNGLKKRR